MKGHLTEKDIIEYEFDLVDEKRTKQIRHHLETCGQCREMAEKLKRRFASLDLLREEFGVRDELISKTVAQVRKTGESRKFLLRKPTWLAAAAAVLLVGFMLLVADFARDKSSGRQFAKDTSSTVENELAEPSSRNAEEASSDNKTPVKALATTRAVRKPAAERLGHSAADMALQAQTREKPPFAPASAIELVTLPRRDNVQITIYNSADLTLVRERRELTLKKGWNWLQFMWANTLIDPTSLSLEPLQQADSIDVQQLVFPARLKDIGRWLIYSQIEGRVPFEVTYFTSGLNWRAFYMGTLSENEKKMRLEGYVRVNNSSGEDYADAQTRLIVGKVHQLDRIADLAKRQYPYDRPGQIKHDKKRGLGATNARVINYSLPSDSKLFSRARPLRPKDIRKESLSEYFLYTIEGTETIPDKWGKRLMSFDVNDIEVTSLYKYDEQRWGKQTVRFISFANDKDHNLGDTPIPNGNVRIYSQADTDGQLSYVGGTGVKYIPVDEDVELNLGSARLVSVEPVLMNFETGNYVFDNKRNVAGFDEIRKWKVIVTNSRKLPVEIEITRGFGTSYWNLEYRGENVSYKKYDAAHGRFKTALAPQSKRTFTYTVTTYHGRREEQANQ